MIASTTLETLPDELILRILSFLSENQVGPRPRADEAHDDPLASDELERCAVHARFATVSRRMCRIVDSTQVLVMSDLSVSPYLRERPVRRLLVQVNNDDFAEESGSLQPWLRGHVEIATVVLNHPYQWSAPAPALPFPCPEVRTYALRELSIVGGKMACADGAWLEPILRDVPTLRILRLSHVDRAVFTKYRHRLVTLQTGIFCAEDLVFLRSMTSGNSTLRHLHLTGIARGRHSGVQRYNQGDPWREVLAEMLRDALPNLRTLTWTGYEDWRQAEVVHRALHCTLPAAERLERLVTGLDACLDPIFEDLVGCIHLKYLRLVRSEHTPGSQVDPHYWTFAALALQVARLLDRPERTAPSLRIEVEVQGPLRKYDCAQRSAREAFDASVEVNRGLEVWLLYYPGRPYRAFPAA